MTAIKNIWNKWKYDGLIVIMCSLTLIYLITSFENIDIKDHNSLLIKYLDAGHFPLPPGYYAIIYFVDLLIRVRYPFVAASTLVLTFFFWWKYKLVFAWITQELKISVRNSFLLTLGLLIMSAVYIPWIDGVLWYMGKFTSTIWHNSTLITVFPFSILLMKFTLDWISNPTQKLGSILIGIGLLVILIKPSFLFCFIPAFPFFVLYSEKKINKKVFGASGIALILFLIILVEKFLIFNWDPMRYQLYTQSEQSQVVIAPMKVWLYFSDQPIFDFVSSFPLLITFLCFWRRQAFQSTFFSFSLLNLFFALLIYGVFAESGFRQYHGNFYWQIPLALFLNSLSICLYVLKEYLHFPQRQFKYYLFFGVFSLQSILGLIYWLRIFFGDTLS